MASANVPRVGGVYVGTGGGSRWLASLKAPLRVNGVHQVFRAERPKPQPPHVIYYYCHQNFSYMLDRPPFPCNHRIFSDNYKVNPQEPRCQTAWTMVWQ